MFQYLDLISFVFGYMRELLWLFFSCVDRIRFFSKCSDSNEDLGSLQLNNLLPEKESRCQNVVKPGALLKLDCFVKTIKIGFSDGNLAVSL